MAEPVLGPSSAGSVVLELGDTVGVLVLEATVELNGREIEISPVDGARHHDDSRDHDHGHDHGHAHAHDSAHDHAHDAHARRTHSMVRERGTAAGKSYAAVYPGLAVGTYTVWRDPDTAVGTVTIDGGRVTRYRWPD
jgi:ABC-type Zn2+ transport system substrate-binding protein/surface adhesin